MLAVAERYSGWVALQRELEAERDPPLGFFLRRVVGSAPRPCARLDLAARVAAEPADSRHSAPPNRRTELVLVKTRGGGVSL